MADVHPSEIEECFHIFAGPSKSRLPADSIGPALRSLGVYVSEAALANLTANIGDEHELDLAEFTKLYERLKGTTGPGSEESLKEIIVQAFRVLDATGTGRVSIKDIRHVVTTLGEKLSDADVDTFLQGAGIPLDTNTSLDYEQFSQMLSYVQDEPIHSLRATTRVRMPET
ncbi:hypothetical protein FOZ63_022895 [Perkinsus olseni]|uniref:Calmodulin n=1 Tax=Perkinsus olseni TaxID=32597 RepID=A0A7J6UNM5_PEROL|nr:hypothetical protein FOZ63_022895 [Perkinsus olseni]